MTTHQKLRMIISYQDKLITQAEKLIDGYPVDPEFITDLAIKIKELRAVLK